MRIHSHIGPSFRHPEALDGQKTRTNEETSSRLPGRSSWNVSWSTKWKVFGELTPLRYFSSRSRKNSGFVYGLDAECPDCKRDVSKRSQTQDWFTFQVRKDRKKR
jgi:hypothetical protein